MTNAIDVLRMHHLHKISVAAFNISGSWLFCIFYRSKILDQSNAFHKQDSSQLKHQHCEHQQGGIQLCCGSLTNHNQLLRCCSIQDIYEMCWAYVLSSWDYQSLSVEPSQHHGWGTLASRWKTAEELLLLMQVLLLLLSTFAVVAVFFTINLSIYFLFWLLLASLSNKVMTKHCECTTSSLLPLSSIIVSSSLHATCTGCCCCWHMCTTVSWCGIMVHSTSASMDTQHAMTM